MKKTLKAPAPANKSARRGGLLKGWAGKPSGHRRRGWLNPTEVRHLTNGVGEIRTHERVSPLAVFKTAAFNHSATTPQDKVRGGG